MRLSLYVEKNAAQLESTSFFRSKTSKNIAAWSNQARAASAGLEDAVAPRRQQPRVPEDERRELPAVDVVDVHLHLGLR